MGLVTQPSIRVLFSDVPVSFPRSSGWLKEIRTSGGYEIIPSTYHHMDALFGVLRETLWFNGTMVHHKPRKHAGIHHLVD